MSTSTAPPLRASSSPPLRAGHIAALAGGSIAALIALALILAGVVLVWAHATQRDSDGFYTSELRRLNTPTAALTAEGLQLGDVDGSDWVVERLDARVRIRAARADGGPVFVGVARENDLDAYLSGIAHEQIREIDGNDVVSGRATGKARAPVPAEQDFWAARVSGRGTQTAEWKANEGRWAAVVMNADGTPRVIADVAVGARTDLLLPVGLALLAAGAIIAVLAVALVVGGLSVGPPSAASAGAPAVTAEHADRTAHPVAVEARLDEPLSRWLWLVKWLLALPHWIVLTFLWAAFAVLTVVAWFAVLFTGRYPRSIFDFNVGVLRWHWRVTYYATSAIGTDRYPPFTLERADYPAELDVPYPERLSRGKALVKTWLLALPHYAILAALFGGGWAVTESVAGPSVVMVLVLVAGAVLAVTGRYPRDVFTLLIGINRWLYRVIAYAALMRDEYPPFRLDR